MKKQYTIIVKKSNGEIVSRTVTAPAGLEGSLAAHRAAVESCGEGAELQHLNSAAIDIDLD